VAECRGGRREGTPVWHHPLSCPSQRVRGPQSVQPFMNIITRQKCQVVAGSQAGNEPMYVLQCP